MEFPMTIRSLAAAASVVATFLTSTALPCIGGEAARDQTVPFAVAAVQGTAPNFAGISNWFNSAPLNIADLRGKVVLVDFWTYGCVKLRQHAAPCHRTLCEIQRSRPSRGRRPHPGIPVRAIGLQRAGRAEAAWHQLSGRAG